MGVPRRCGAWPRTPSRGRHIAAARAATEAATTSRRFAVREGRVFVTNDGPAEAIGIGWLRQGRPFPGMICWPQRYHDLMSTGD
jgi:hypothetical protein